MTHKSPLERLLDVMSKLRSPEGGCPWDLKQDHKTLKTYAIEEVYELLDAIDQEDDDAIQEELGDVLLQVIFHAQIASETDRFDFQDVCRSLVDKLVHRHPHVFGDKDGTSMSEADVRQAWEKLKVQEGKTSLFSGLAKHLPALQTSDVIGQKAASVGFDWASSEQVWEKVEEELQELRSAKTPETKLEEAGDLLFSICQYVRHHGISAEDALRAANRKFLKRFGKMEASLDSPDDMSALDADAWQALWEKAK